MMRAGKAKGREIWSYISYVLSVQPGPLFIFCYDAHRILAMGVGRFRYVRTIPFLSSPGPFATRS
jgi:hypothetical protein